MTPVGFQVHQDERMPPRKWEDDLRYPLLYPFHKDDIEWLEVFADVVECLVESYPEMAEAIKIRHWVDEPKRS